MAREATFNFISAHLVNKTFTNGQTFNVTIMTHPGKVLSFPSNHPETRALIGKYLQWFVDTDKNVLGWKVFEKGELSDLNNASEVVEYVSGKTRTVRASLALPMKGLSYEPKKSYLKLEVKKYRQQGMLNDGKAINYVEVERPKRKHDGIPL